MENVPDKQRQMVNNVCLPFDESIL